LTYANKKLLLEHQEKFISTGYDDVVDYIYKTKLSEIPPASARKQQSAIAEETE